MFSRSLVARMSRARFFGTVKMKHQDIIDNYINLSAGERVKTIFTSAIGAFRDPWR